MNTKFVFEYIFIIFLLTKHLFLYVSLVRTQDLLKIFILM